MRAPGSTGTPKRIWKPSLMFWLHLCLLYPAFETQMAAVKKVKGFPTQASSAMCSPLGGAIHHLLACVCVCVYVCFEVFTFTLMFVPLFFYSFFCQEQSCIILSCPSDSGSHNHLFLILDTTQVDSKNFIHKKEIYKELQLQSAEKHYTKLHYTNNYSRLLWIRYNCVQCQCNLSEVWYSEFPGHLFVK